MQNNPSDEPLLQDYKGVILMNRYREASVDRWTVVGNNFVTYSIDNNTNF